MKRVMRLEGLYDKKTIQLLQTKANTALTFDFRPRSFNFIQQYLFLDFITVLKNSTLPFSIQYENEPDFMIKDTLQKLDAIYSGPVSLEFSDNQKCEYYEQFSRPFIWHYNVQCSDISVFKSPLLKGIVLNYSDIEDAHNKNILTSFVQNFYRLTHDVLLKRNGQLILKLDWTSNVMPTLAEYFDFNVISVPVNSNVEICYRNVDQNKLQSSLESLKNFTNAL
ncbi:hypothetical protein [Bacteriovorax sp. BSW11_IV]|uniref:hypothetical protein n=1 Tax=Bacteriovorax sp. BSW11_IV TaxID=1353529 RepID=UPI0012DDDA13|nr:hypothetical protein [Bacteriovorax sp. BSW11_IV]